MCTTRVTCVTQTDRVDLHTPTPSVEPTHVLMQWCISNESARTLVCVCVCVCVCVYVCVCVCVCVFADIFLSP